MTDQMNLLITDRESGKEYKGQQGWHDLLEEKGITHSYMENLCTNGIAWCIDYCNASDERSRYALYPLERFSISFPGQISEEKVRGVLDAVEIPKEEEMIQSMKERDISPKAFKWILAMCYATITETKKEIASALNINLSEDLTLNTTKK